MSYEKKVQVCKSEESHIDRDFQTIRNRFDDEMKRMENEMSRFRGSLLDHNQEIDTRRLSPTARQKEISSFVDSFESPLIKESSDGKVLKLKFDVTDYEPEEIVVKTVDNKLQVSLRANVLQTHKKILPRKLTSFSTSQLIYSRFTQNTRRNQIQDVCSVNTIESFSYRKEPIQTWSNLLYREMVF